MWFPYEISCFLASWDFIRFRFGISCFLAVMIFLYEISCFFCRINFFWDFLMRVYAFRYIIRLWERLIIGFHAFWPLRDCLIRFHAFWPLCDFFRFPNGFSCFWPQWDFLMRFHAYLLHSFLMRLPNEILCFCRGKICLWEFMPFSCIVIL